MDSSEDAENIHHLQWYGELQVIANAVWQRTDTQAAKHHQQRKSPSKTIVTVMRQKKRDGSEPSHESVRLKTGWKWWPVKVGSSSSQLARRGLKQRCHKWKETKEKEEWFPSDLDQGADFRTADECVGQKPRLSPVSGKSSQCKWQACPPLPKYKKENHDCHINREVWRMIFGDFLLLKRHVKST